MKENNSNDTAKDQNKENKAKKPEKIEVNNKRKEKSENQNEILSLIASLKNFENYLKSLESIYSILKKENINFLKKLSLKENIKINQLLIKIYLDIISNESLYSQYLTSISEKDIDKIEILFQLIENCVSLTEKLNTFSFSSDFFEFKKKIIELIKCIYYNCKTYIKDELKLKKISELLEKLPSKYFSESFIELNKSKESYEVYKSQKIKKITDFEEKFSGINNYYEQLESFKKFVENNSGMVNCSSVNNESIGKKTDNNELKTDSLKIEFYVQYGSLILKFCKYHNYMFLDKKEETENKDKEDKEDKDEKDKENIRVIFLLDHINKEKSKDEEKDKGKKIENILRHKRFVSSVDSKEYKELIRKEINNYLKITKDLEKDEKIKSVREHLIYYLGTLDIDSYYPLYLNDFTKVTISDNFTPSFLTNVPARGINKFYFETPEEEDTLVYIEYSLEDKSKDINFELNKYEINKNEFISAFKDEKNENNTKFFITCHGYSLYEIVFDNSYSWFNSKDINYRVSFLKLSNNAIKEQKVQNQNEQKNEYVFEINGKKFVFNIINKKIEIKEENAVNIPIILYLNNIKIVSFKKNDNDKNEDELIFKEHKEEDETIIPKHLFNYLLIGYLKKKKIGNTKKIVLNIFSLNRDLLPLCEELNEEISNANNEQQKNYIKNIGFIPDDKIDNYNFEHKLFDPNEQILLYHIFLNFKKNNKIPTKSVLLIEFDKLIANVAIYNKGELLIKFKDKDNNFNSINIDNVDEILYIIKYANDNFEEIELVISKKNNIEEDNKKKLMDAIGKIKKYCLEIINPPIKIFEYEHNDILYNTIKYINFLYKN